MQQNLRRDGFLMFDRSGDVYTGFDLKTGTPRELSRLINCTKAEIERLPLQADAGDVQDYMDSSLLRCINLPQRVHWFRNIPGFGVMVGRTTKSYFVAKKVRGRRECYYTIGKTSSWSLDAATREAKRLLSQMDMGVDPHEARKSAERENEARKLTLRCVLAEFSRHTTKTKPVTLARYEEALERKASSLLDMPIKDITFDVIHRVFSPMLRVENGKPIKGYAYAGQALVVLARLFSYAEARWHDIVVKNPARLVKRALQVRPEKPRTGHIASDRLAEFFLALSAVEAKAQAEHDVQISKLGDACQRRQEKKLNAALVACDYLRFVVGTGLRRNEAARLQWSNVDFHNGTIKILETKNGDVHIVPITTYHRSILERRKVVAEMRASPWVFPTFGTKGADGPLSETKSVTAVVGATMGQAFTVHDLRRTFASVAAECRLPWHIIKRLLNHRLGGDITALYVQTSLGEKREAMEQITARLMQAQAEAQGIRIATA